MKVLVYNFVQPDEPGKQSGGVAFYQKNLTKALLDRGHGVISMSSGDRYSAISRPPFLRNEKSTQDPQRFERLFLFNSPVLAPSHYSFYDLNIYNQSPELDRIAAELRNLYGEIDVFHFQNIEGLTAGFFESVRHAFPNSRLIVSAHNYNLVCPQVNLWFRETLSCVDYRDGYACVNCIGGHGPQTQEINVRRMDALLSFLGVKRHRSLSKIVEFTARLPFRLRRAAKQQVERTSTRSASGVVSSSEARTIVNPSLASEYRAYRETNVGLCRNVFDNVIAVSQRTKDVLAMNGIPKNSISVSYIGTSHYSRYLDSHRKTSLNGRLHMAYLGYMRSDKGFFFFMECLHLIPDHVANRMAVTIAAPYANDWSVEQLKQLAHKFDELKIYNGYKHQTIDDILHDVDLGVVPVLWEDNLPQVAIEIVSRGIPILTSDKGGASEIASQPNFTFESGSKHDFLGKLERIASGAVPLAEFWNSDLRIFSMDHHLDDLMTFYGAENTSAN